MRLIMAPVSNLLGQYIDRSGDAWKQRQAVASADSCRGGEGKADTLGPVADYVTLVLETEFFAALRGVLTGVTYLETAGIIRSKDLL